VAKPSTSRRIVAGSRRSIGVHCAAAPTPPSSRSAQPKPSSSEQHADATRGQRWAARAVAVALAAIETVTPMTSLLPPPPAEALLSSPNAKVPRTVDAALRRSIPVVNPVSKEILDKIEDAAFLLRIPQRKPYANMTVDAEKSIELLEENRAMLLASVPAEEQSRAEEVLDSLKLRLEKLVVAITTRDPDRVGFNIAAVFKVLTELEMLQAPALPYSLPPQYDNLPRLTGRATAQFTLKRTGDGEFVSRKGGGGSKEAVLEVVLDGYSAPLTAGHFAQLVEENYYNNATIAGGEGALYVGGKGSAQKETPATALQLPFEVMSAGDFEPHYRLPLDVQGGEMPVIPMSVYGSVVMGRGENYESDPAKFFFYLFDKASSGLGGLSFEEGNFATFGYVSEGEELLRQIRSGDVVTSAKLIAGADRLVSPQ